MKYTDQGILSYVNSPKDIKTTIALNRKFFLKSKRHSSFFKASPTQKLESKNESLRSLDSSSEMSPVIFRLYIIAHCRSGSEYLYCDDNSKIHYKEVANHVVSALKQMNNNSLSFHPDSSIKISLLACSAGSGKGGNPSGSFAEYFFNELWLKGITADVVARVVPVEMGCDRLNFWKVTDSFDDNQKRVHHQAGSKVLFTLDEKGAPIFKDAYSATWKSQVLLSIQNCATKTNKKNKKRALETMHEKLNSQPEGVIFDTLKIFVEQKKCFIDEGDFWGKTDTRKAFEKLVEEGTRIIKDPHTIATTYLKQEVPLTLSS